MKVLFQYLHWVSLFHIHWFLAFLPWLIHWEFNPFPSAYRLASLLYASSYSYLWPLSLLLSAEENTIYPQVVWTSLNENCKEIEANLWLFPLNGLKTKWRACVLFSYWLTRMNSIYALYPQCPLEIHKSSCPLSLTFKKDWN